MKENLVVIVNRALRLHQGFFPLQEGPGVPEWMLRKHLIPHVAAAILNEKNGVKIIDIRTDVPEWKISL